eukprot:scaffold16330_cov172-Amphora_coffeaeformis.AAC.5
MRDQQRTRRSRKRQRLVSVQGLAIAIFILVVLSATRTSAKLSGSSVSSRPGLIVCRITVEDTIYQSDAPYLYSLEQTVCVPVNDGVEYPETYRVQLPNHMTKLFHREIQMGRLHVAITKASIEHDAIVTTPETTFSVVNEEYDRSQRYLQDETNYRHAFGRKRYMLVRISTSDSEPMYTLDHMVKRFTDATEGMEAQYLDCSKQQVQFEMTGAYDVQLPSNLETYEASPRWLREAAVEQIMVEHNIARFPEDVADHVLFCIPPGTGSWVANAATGHWRTQYNDHWCLSLSAVMHEVRVDVMVPE